MDESGLFERLSKEARGRGLSLGIVGGTFDPIHLGHTALGEAARTELGLDGVLYIPAGVPSFKRGRRIASGEDRVAMARLATRSLPHSAVSTREIERAGVTYTVDTLRELRADWPEGTRLVFVMGEDSLATFSLWHRAPEILELCELAVASRAGAWDVGETSPPLGRPARVHRLTAQLPAVSSTEVRRVLAEGGTTVGLLDPKVAEYIRSGGLYRGSDTDGATACVKG